MLCANIRANKLASRPLFKHTTLCNCQGYVPFRLIMASQSPQPSPLASKEDFDSSNAPALRVMGHILQKGFQAGSVLGVGLAAPAQAALQYVRHKQAADMYRAVATAGRTNAVVFGLIAVLGALRVGQLDKDGLEDRTYRLHYNKGQNRTDTFAQVGAFGGLAAGALLLRGAAGATPFHYLGTASAGTALGVLAHVLTRPQEE
eukprot:GHUV01006187.1.p1 GENE.GHUV01006187.1~~GHUV01006187.1.p1  ORF type:complete len:203 (+),score=54.09 GHUV01006187.1:302-910(+)